MKLQANGISIEYELAGPPDGPPLVMITGLGSQLTHWSEDLIAGFAAAGYRVITFDNRDVGLTSRVPGPGPHPTPDEIRARLKAGEEVVAPYGLPDMADDVAALITGLGYDRAHVFGISMGGMVTQQLMIAHPDRLLSATVVMSSAEPSRIANADRLILDRVGREDYIAEAVAGFTDWGSPGFPAPDSYFRDKAARAWDRGHDADGVNRQLLAVVRSPDRRERLRRVNLPVLIIHGADDTLIGPEHGRALAALIPGAELEIIEGMGHTIPPLLAPVIVARMRRFLAGYRR
ncbi:MAG: alpha/beta fold hydrolase [Rhodobacterales bacterium]|nr:alpha/beta fold hydrolase [Rhodobacterales bacterium]